MAYLNGYIVSVSVDGKVYKEVNISGRRVIQVPYMPNNIDLSISGKPKTSNTPPLYPKPFFVEIESSAIGKQLEPLHYFKGDAEIVNQHKCKTKVEWNGPFNAIFKTTIVITAEEALCKSFYDFEIYFVLGTNNLQTLLEYFDQSEEAKAEWLVNRWQSTSIVETPSKHSSKEEEGTVKEWKKLSYDKKKVEWESFFKMLARFNKIAKLSIEQTLEGYEKGDLTATLLTDLEQDKEQRAQKKLQAKEKEEIELLKKLLEKHGKKLK